MKSKPRITHGGGWIPHRRFGRPITRFLGFLCVIWLAVSVPAAFAFFEAEADLSSTIYWLSGLALVGHGILIIAAVACWRMERKRLYVEYHADERLVTRCLH